MNECDDHRTCEGARPDGLDCPVGERPGGHWGGAVPETVLRGFFAEFEALGVEYCVMRNFSQLPRAVGSSDLDVLVRPAHHRAAEQAIRRVLERCGGRVVARVPAKGSYLKTMGFTDGRWWGLAIDLVADVDYKGLVYITADDVLKRSEWQAGVRVASEGDAAIGALAKDLINNLETSDRYAGQARLAWSKQGDACLMSLVGFGPAMRAEIGEFLAEKSADEAGAMRSLGRRMRRELIRHHGVLRRGVAMGGELARRVARIRRRPGALLAVAGGDAGLAAALIEGMLPVLGRAFHKRVLVGEDGPRGLSKALSTDGSGAVGREQVVDKVGRTSFAGALWEYTAGYFRWIYPRMVGRPHLVIINRYYGAAEREMKGRAWACWWLRVLSLKPDFVLRVRAGAFGGVDTNPQAEGVGADTWYRPAARCLELGGETAPANANQALEWLMGQLGARVDQG